MLKKGGVIRTRAQCGNAKISAVACFLFSFGISFHQRQRLRPLGDGNLLLRILNVTSDFVYEFFKRMGTASIQKAAAVAIAVDVKSSMLPEFLSMRFHPF